MPQEQEAHSSRSDEDQFQHRSRFARSPYGWIAGVCAGLADYTGINLAFIRLVFVALTPIVPPIGPIAYIILAVVMPAGRRPAAVLAEASIPQPPAPRKSLFAYMFAAGGVCASFVAFGSDTLELYEKFARLFIGDRAPEPSMKIVDTPQMTRPVTNYTRDEIGVQGSATVRWRALGGTYTASLDMRGASGSASVAIVQGSQQGVVYERLTSQYTAQGLMLVGEKPSQLSYSPDTFHLAIDGGWLRVTLVCDFVVTQCYHVDGFEGDLQLVR